ncbi:HK97 family phage prohead protease [Enterococcus hirae]
MEQKSIETRSVEDVKPLENMTISGYAIKFDEKSKLLGNYYEIIDSKALNKTDLSDVKCYFNHDSSAVLGRTKAKTLELIIDDKGLMFSRWCSFGL